MSAHQKALDNAVERQMNSEDADEAKAAQGTAANLRVSFGFSLYCPAHRGNHHFGADALEELIYALQAQWSDSALDHALAMTHLSQGSHHDDDAPSYTNDEILGLCPRDWYASIRDPECYSEHIESMVGARRDSEDVPE